MQVEPSPSHPLEPSNPLPHRVRKNDLHVVRVLLGLVHLLARLPGDEKLPPVLYPPHVPRQHLARSQTDV